MHSIIHDAYYHELHKLSNDITVLVFSGLTSFVRMVLQREENKGVEFTVYLHEDSGAMECGWLRVSKGKSNPARLNSEGSGTLPRRIDSNCIGSY